MSNKKIELRFNPSDITSNEDGSLKVSGYVNKTDEPSNMLQKSAKRFVEKISRGAFKNALLNKGKDIDFLAEHDKKRILASTKNQSLSLFEDDNGLFMEATITPTSWGKDTYEMIKSGLYTNMSFGFKAIKDEWKKTGIGLYERTIRELELFEVSVVKNPAYASTTIEARGIDVIENVDIPEEIRMEETNMDEKTIEEQFKALHDAIGTIAEGMNTLLANKEDRSSEDDEKEEDKSEEREDQKEKDSDGTEKDTKESDEDKKDEDEKEDREDETDEDKKEKEEEKCSQPHQSVIELRNRLESLKQED
ncbi:HK97 family phage prohead protease [Staphylococcus equorum]|uniref:HK97 family phage prohead protease n=1 Tax=Staphylococcus equorum TaxID=246432 RepID=UPI003216F438